MGWVLRPLKLRASVPLIVIVIPGQSSWTHIAHIVWGLVSLVLGEFARPRLAVFAVLASV